MKSAATQIGQDYLRELEWLESEQWNIGWLRGLTQRIENDDRLAEVRTPFYADKDK